MMVAQQFADMMAGRQQNLHLGDFIIAGTVAGAALPNSNRTIPLMLHDATASRVAFIAKTNVSNK